MTSDRLARFAIAPVNPVLNVSRSANLPHVPGIRIGDYLFLSGMGPIDPVTGERRHGPIADQVRTTLGNMKHMLESAGSSLERVVRVHVVLADIADLPEADRVWREAMDHNRTPMSEVADDDTFWNGTPEEMADKLRPYVDLGFRTVISEQPAPYDVETLERFIGEVKPLIERG